MFSINLKNFRSFKDQTFHFDKFNILIGENSSGKSSLFKFLLAAKQTLETPHNREINFLFSGEFVDLGSYKESIYYHQDELPLIFDFVFAESYIPFFLHFMLGEDASTKKIKQSLDDFFNENLPNSISQISFELTKELNSHDSIKTRISNSEVGNLYIDPMPIDKKSSKNPLVDNPKCRIIYSDIKANKKYVLDNIGYSKDGFLTIIDPGDLRQSCGKVFTNEDDERKPATIVKQINRLFNRIALLLVVQNFVRYNLENIEYVNPINTHPSRFYIKKDQKKFSTINNLDDVMAFFSAPDDYKLKLLKDFIKILKKLGIADHIEIMEDERLPVMELRVKVKDLLSNISDVGYGVSLQIPVILKALLADRLSDGYKIILIEQPEVHLHPKLHSALIEVLVSLSKNTVYFIETHSEHVIRKLQVMVKEKSNELLPNQVTIHYLVRKNKHSEVTKHPIMETGYLSKSLPTGFFDNSFQLSKQLL